MENFIVFHRVCLEVLEDLLFHSIFFTFHRGCGESLQLKVDSLQLMYRLTAMIEIIFNHPRSGYHHCQLSTVNCQLNYSFVLTFSMISRMVSFMGFLGSDRAVSIFFTALMTVV